MIAAEQGHVEVVRLLLDAGADINLASNNGLTASMLAADQGHVEVARLLVEAVGNRFLGTYYGGLTRGIEFVDPR